MSRTPLIAGNWKMHGSLALVAEFGAAFKSWAAPQNIELLLCPPSVYLPSLKAQLADTAVHVGAQNLAAEPDGGAFTGELSGRMLADAGAQYVIVGHSERRSLYHETDAIVAKKTQLAAAAGLKPILCIGESLAQREQGQTFNVLASQLDAVLSQLDDAALAKLTIAYEPIWAIGTGHSATPEQVQETHAFIRQHIEQNSGIIPRSIRLLYGGSVKPNNAVSILSNKDVDGALVGGASLQADSFKAIAQAAI